MRKQQANPAMARDDLLPEDYALDQTISEAATWLTSRQQGDGALGCSNWGRCDDPSEYILLNHYLGDIRDDLERQIAKYIRHSEDMADGRCITTATSI